MTEVRHTEKEMKEAMSGYKRKQELEKKDKETRIGQAVIIAGGLGTRLKPFTEAAPKPMYPFEGRPFIEYLVKQVKSFGIDRILILLGYLPEKIMDYLGNGERYGVRITYDVTPVEYETGKRMKAALAKMEKEFLFLYCDNYCPVNYGKLLEMYRCSQAAAQITAYSNRDGYTKNNLKIAEDGRVEIYDKKRAADGLRGVDIGYAFIRRRVVEMLPEENVNFEAYVYPRLVQEGQLYAAICEHRYYSVGSWERIELAKQFFKPRKVVFLDRDGTINERPPKACYVEEPEQFIWLPYAKKAIKRLREMGYQVILISNQPGIARGRLTVGKLDEIHAKMQEDLRKEGTGIDAVYYCPHDWDEGCFCRKPSPGLLYEAQKDYSLNLRECVFIGDDERDMEAAEQADMRGILVGRDYSLWDAVEELVDEQKICLT